MPPACGRIKKPAGVSGRRRPAVPGVFWREWSVLLARLRGARGPGAGTPRQWGVRAVPQKEPAAPRAGTAPGRGIRCPGRPDHGERIEETPGNLPGRAQSTN